MVRVAHTEAGDNQFSCEVDVAEEILLQSEVLKTDWTDILVEDESSSDSPVHQHGSFLAELVRKNPDLCRKPTRQRVEAVFCATKGGESNYRISGNLGLVGSAPGQTDCPDEEN